MRLTINVSLEQVDNHVLMQRLEVEADELLSFVKNKQNKPWLWLAMDIKTKQVLAFYVGDRRKHSARKLGKAIPQVYKQTALCYTDQYESYPGVIPADQHRALSKQFRKANHIECLNCTLRQRIFRLVRATLSFSQKLDNHIGAIRYFLCHYNLTLAAKLARLILSWEISITSANRQPLGTLGSLNRNPRYIGNLQLAVEGQLMVLIMV